MRAIRLRPVALRPTTLVGLQQGVVKVRHA